MRFSSKVQKCQLSPVRKFNPCAEAAGGTGPDDLSSEYRPAGCENAGGLLRGDP